MISNSFGIRATSDDNTSHSSSQMSMSFSEQINDGSAGMRSLLTQNCRSTIYCQDQGQGQRQRQMSKLDPEVGSVMGWPTTHHQVKFKEISGEV